MTTPAELPASPWRETMSTNDAEAIRRVREYEEARTLTSVGGETSICVTSALFGEL